MPRSSVAASGAMSDRCPRSRLSMRDSAWWCSWRRFCCCLDFWERPSPESHRRPIVKDRLG